MTSPEPIYVSMTSWYKRINNVKPVIDTILNQSLQPYKIILNLCIQDFPKLEQDLPQELLDLINSYSNIELYWFYENYKAWKKHLHTLDMLPDDALALCIDDDHLYPSDFIEKMYLSYCFYGKKFPITSNKIMLVHSAWCFNGSGTLYRKSDWGDYKKYLTQDILHKCYEDVFISVLFHLNNVTIAPLIFHIPDDKEMLFNDNDSFSDLDASSNTQENVSSIKNMNTSTVEAIIDTLEKHWRHNDGSFKYNPNVWQIMYEYYSNYDIDNLRFKPLKFSYDNFNKLTINNTLYSNTYDIDKEKLDIDLYHYNKSHYIPINKKLIVSIASWSKRINNVSQVIRDILHNSFLPDKIVINLAKSDFQNTRYTCYSLYELVYETHTFPEDLYNLIKDNNDLIEIHWYDDASIKSWKKYEYVTKNYKNDIIIAIDDDIRYSPMFIETMVKSFYYYGSKYPISTLRSFCQGGFGICGNALLYTSQMLGDFDSKYFTNDILHNFPEDNHILNIINLLGYPVMPVIGYNYLYSENTFEDKDSNFGNFNFDDKWFESYNKLMTVSSKILDENKNEKMYSGWQPNCYNYTIYNLQKFVNDNNRESLPKYQKYVYDAIVEYLNDSPGTKFSSNLYQNIDNVIL